MGRVHQFFQPPLYWQQFEDLCVGMLREVYSSADAQAVGRPGQAQNGIDVYGSSRFGMIGIQCKRLTSHEDENGNPRPGGPISKAFLFKAAEEGLAFRPDLQIWILATTARRGTLVQGYVDELNQVWRKEKRSRTALVWSWDDCISHLNTFPSLQRAYYDDVVGIRSERDLDAIILRVIETAFRRPAFDVPLHCETTVDFLQALKDTHKALRTGELVDRESRQVIMKAVGGYIAISNDQQRAALGEVDDLLAKLRRKIEGGMKDGRIRTVHDFLDFRDMGLAHRLEDIRHECVDKLNHVLLAAGMTPV